MTTDMTVITHDPTGVLTGTWLSPKELAEQTICGAIPVGTLAQSDGSAWRMTPDGHWQARCAIVPAPALESHAR